MDSTTMDSAQRTVLILTPFDSDVDDIAAVVPEETPYQRCVNLSELVDGLRALGNGTVVVAAEEALAEQAVEDLSTLLTGQPIWSSIPLLLLTRREADLTGPNERLWQLLDNALVTLLDRPVRASTLARNLRSCLNARRRQRQIGDQLQAERNLRRKDQHQALARGQEEERKRIAGELHNDFAQRMAILSMQLDRLTLSPPAPDEISRQIKSCKAHVEQLCDDLRDLSHRLHPALLDILGLTPVLQAECERAAQVTGFPVHFHSDSAAEDLSPDFALALYRVVQEALRNTAQHAEARHANVTLSVSGAELYLTIEDDGKGFDPEAVRMSKRGLGLLSMAERLELFDGRLSVDSELGTGTRIQAIAPLALKRDKDPIVAEDRVDRLHA